MNSHTTHRRMPFTPPTDLAKRLELAMNVYNELGFINRQSLIDAYQISQAQAGSLMRDFIHAHAKNLKWDTSHQRYLMKNL